MSLNASLIMSQCSASFQSESNRAACNFMLASIADGCGVNTDGFLSNRTANQQTDALSAKAADVSSGWQYLGQGDVGALRAVNLANAGYFVAAAWKSSGAHGHVSVAHMGAPSNGWPMGTWGVFNDPEHAEVNKSLRWSFGSSIRPDTKFFACELP